MVKHNLMAMPTSAILETEHMKKHWQRGFTMIELSISMLFAMTILAVTLQLMNQSNKMFVRVKDRSDRIVDITLAREQIDFYMERWGKGVFSVAVEMPMGHFPPQDKYIRYIQNDVMVKADETEDEDARFDSFSFLANLEGYAVADSIDSVEQNKMRLLSCRLQSGAASDATSGCYSILRRKSYWQAPDVYLLMEERQANSVAEPAHELDFDKTMISYARINGLDTISDNQCIDQATYAPNMTANKLLSFADGTNTNIELFGNYELEPGDFIQPLPQRIRMFVKEHAEDQNAPWLYISAEPITDCPESGTEIAAIAPVKSFKIDTATENVLKMQLNLGYATQRLRNQFDVPPIELEYYYD